MRRIISMLALLSSVDSIALVQPSADGQEKMLALHPPTQDALLAALVQKLGDNSYAVRAAAARDLIAAGARAVPALMAGQSHADPEVARRCRQLLPKAAEEGRKNLLGKLVNDSDDPPPKGLAGVVRFLKITGDNRASRRLYAQMMATDAVLVEALETNPKAAGRLFAAFADERIGRAERADRDPYSEMLTSPGEVALFLFIRSDARFDDTQGTGSVMQTQGWQTMVLLRALRFESEVAGPKVSPGMKKLFLHWLAVERQVDEMHTAYEIARKGKMTEAVPIALKAVNDRKNGSCFRATLMLDFLAEMGTTDQIKDLAPLLADGSADLGSLRVGQDGPVLAPQVRDIALAVSIHLAGQNPADFGFHAAGFEDKAYHKYYGGYAFIDSAARDAAQAKWQAWVKGKERPER